MGLFFRKKEKDGFAYHSAAKWLDNVLTQDIPEDAAAFCFNLYDDGDSKWSMELVGTQRFDADDTDWPCDEVTDFGTREKPFVWSKTADWDTVLNEVISVLTDYLENGKHADVLKSGNGVGVGFTDGDLTILYSEPPPKSN